jgi:hypothetical protein
MVPWTQYKTRNTNLNLYLVEIARSKLHEDVEEVDDVKERVKDEPAGVAGRLDLSEGFSQDASPQVVQHGQCHHAQPVEHEVAIMGDGKVPWRLERPANQNKKKYSWG